MVTDAGLSLFRRFLTYDPKKRITCDEALKDDYFRESPLAIDPSMFPTWPAKSEMSARGGQGRRGGSPKPPSGIKKLLFEILKRNKTKVVHFKL